MPDHKSGIRGEAVFKAQFVFVLFALICASGSDAHRNLFSTCIISVGYGRPEESRASG